MPIYRFSHLERTPARFELKVIGPPESEGYIKFDNEILSTNIYAAYDILGELLPPLLKQWRNKYDFHFVPLNCLLVKHEKARGVKQLMLGGKIIGGAARAVQVQDIGPKTKWVEDARSLNVELGLGFDIIGVLLSFVELAPIPVTGKVLFKYKWNPKVGAVKSGFAGRDMSWELNNTEGKYLDGSHTLLMIVRRNRSIKTLHFRLTYGIVLHDLPFWQGFDRAYIPRESLIPIEFTESSVSQC